MVPWTAFDQHQIGDGKDTYLWLDNWHPLGPLYKKYDQRIVFTIGRSLEAKFWEIIHMGLEMA